MEVGGGLQNCKCQPPVLYKFQSSDSRTQFNRWKTHSLFLLDHVLAKTFYLIDFPSWTTL